MPATTGISAIPTGRPGFEAQAGAVPAFYLSRSAQDATHSGAVLQLAALVEPDRWIGVPGLIAGARLFGQGQDTPLEPYIGYRYKLNDMSLAGVVYGTAKRATDKLATYHATRIGAEAAADVPIVRYSRHVAIHAQAALAATRINASGTYCANSDGVGIDCDTTQPTLTGMIDGHVDGVFPSGTLTLALDAGRDSASAFHMVRLALLGSASQMPLVRNGMQESTGITAFLGMTLTVGFGAR